MMFEKTGLSCCESRYEVSAEDEVQKKRVLSNDK